jgi:alpha-tubulin suppressor-like RCC1 family protein
VAVAGDHVFTQISVGFEHVCAITPTGEAYCWGDNLSGQLGDGTSVRRSIPTLVGSNIAFKSISAGNLQTCALSFQGKAFCWGGDSYGEIGVACDTVPCTLPTPQTVSGDLTFVAVSAGNTFTCGVSASAEAWCWGGLDLPWSDGLGRKGVLGDGSSHGSATPVRVTGNHRFTEVAAGAGSACGVTEGNEAFCWGVNFSGQLGTGTVDDNGHPNPTRLGPGITWSHITAGDSSCGLDHQGVAYCWAMVYGDPDASGGIRIKGLWTSPTLLPDPVK